MPPKLRPNAEADGYVETKLQYHHTEPPLPLQINPETFKKTVRKMKSDLVKLDALKDVVGKLPPSELGLFLVLKDKTDQEPEQLKRMEDNALVKDYSTEIAHARRLKLLTISNVHQHAS